MNDPRIAALRAHHAELFGAEHIYAARAGELRVENIGLNRNLNERVERRDEIDNAVGARVRDSVDDSFVLARAAAVNRGFANWRSTCVLRGLTATAFLNGSASGFGRAPASRFWTSKGHPRHHVHNARVERRRRAYESELRAVIEPTIPLRSKRSSSEGLASGTVTFNVPAIRARSPPTRTGLLNPPRDRGLPEPAPARQM